MMANITKIINGSGNITSAISGAKIANKCDTKLHSPNDVAKYTEGNNLLLHKYPVYADNATPTLHNIIITGTKLVYSL